MMVVHNCSFVNCLVSDWQAAVHHYLCHCHCETERIRSDQHHQGLPPENQSFVYSELLKLLPPQKTPHYTKKYQYPIVYCRKSPFMYSESLDFFSHKILNYIFNLQKIRRQHFVSTDDTGSFPQSQPRWTTMTLNLSKIAFIIFDNWSTNSTSKLVQTHEATWSAQ